MLGTRLGLDVVISSKLTTDFNKTPVSRNVGKLIKSAADGWEAPLENLEAQEVNVCDGEILSCSDLIDAEKQCQSHPGAIAVEMEGKGENYSHGDHCEENCFARLHVFLMFSVTSCYQDHSLKPDQTQFYKKVS